MSGFALVFPGQGSQYVGMGRELYASSPVARRVFEEAEEMVGFALRRLCFEGPEEELWQTNKAQPALLAASIASYEVLLHLASGSLPAPRCVAGHSLGEYTASVVAGILPFAEAVRLVHRRGLLMATAARARPGAMAAIMGLDEEQVTRLCAAAPEDGLVCIANYNCPGQIVVSGELQAVTRLGERAKREGARRVTMLPVGGAFHSPLMGPAARSFAELVAALPLGEARIPVIGNVSGRPLRSGKEIRQELTQHLAAPVRWSQTMAWALAAGVELFAEVGPGQVLAGLAKRCGAKRVFNIEGPADAERFLQALDGEEEA